MATPSRTTAAPTDAVLRRARALYDARRTGVPIPPLTDEDPTLGIADGYAVQEQLVAMLLADGEEIVGYKVGLTSTAMQRSIGVDSPDYGPVFASTAIPDGGELRLAGLIAPKAEAEIVFRLASELRGPGITVDQARAAIAGAAAGMEIVDSRIADWRIKLADTVADLASNGALVVADRFVSIDDFDPRLVGMVLSRNGEVVETGVGAAALGDPVAVVAWLANTLGEHGVALEAGHLVMTGSLHAPLPLAGGDVFTAEFDRLGSVTLQVAGRE